MPYASLGDFLVNAPLYQDVAFKGIQTRQHQNGSDYVRVPSLIDRQCATCGPTKWEFDLGTYGQEASERSIHHVRYKCRNCQGKAFDAWFWWWSAAAGA